MFAALVFAKITGAEFSSEEGSDSLKWSEMSKNEGRGKGLDYKPVTLERDFIPHFLA